MQWASWDWFLKWVLRDSGGSDNVEGEVQGIKEEKEERKNKEGVQSTEIQNFENVTWNFVSL